MNGKKNDGRMLDMEELDKVTDGEERRKDFNPMVQPGNYEQQRIGGDIPLNYLTPEQIQKILNAAMENTNPTKGPVKK